VCSACGAGLHWECRGELVSCPTLGCGQVMVLGAGPRGSGHRWLGKLVLLGLALAWAASVWLVQIPGYEATSGVQADSDLRDPNWDPDMGTQPLARVDPREVLAEARALSADPSAEGSYYAERPRWHRVLNEPRELAELPATIRAMEPEAVHVNEYEVRLVWKSSEHPRGFGLVFLPEGSPASHLVPSSRVVYVWLAPGVYSFLWL